jgi:hypothetical protein
MIRYPKYPMAVRARMIRIAMISFFIIYPSPYRSMTGGE